MVYSSFLGSIFSGLTRAFHLDFSTEANLCEDDVRCLGPLYDAVPV